MKISNRTHPVLDFLNKDHSFRIALPNTFDRDQTKNVQDVIKYSWPLLRHKFKSNINYISQSFSDAADFAIPKMKSNPEQFRLDTGNYDGVFLIGQLSICYSLEVIQKDNEEHIKCHFFVFREDCLICINARSENDGDRIYRFYNNLLKGDKCYYGIEARDEILDVWFWICRVWILFKKYAEVETKLLPAGQKTNAINIKYVNESKSNITVLDSKWFTTLVKSDAFKVRGHFHFYWYSTRDGVKCEPFKKLIWIADYDKEGYTAPAKKLNQNI